MCTSVQAASRGDQDPMAPQQRRAVFALDDALARTGEQLLEELEVHMIPALGRLESGAASAVSAAAEMRSYRAIERNHVPSIRHTNEPLALPAWSQPTLGYGGVSQVLLTRSSRDARELSCAAPT